jgi:triosephosphate isomerase
VTQGEVHSAEYREGLIQEINITIKENKDAPKCPFGVLVCMNATNETNVRKETKQSLTKQIMAVTQGVYKRMVRF